MLREQSLNREVAAWVSAVPVGRPAAASLRTVGASHQHRLLLRRHAGRLGALFPRQQGLPLLPAARSPAVHSPARPHAALVGLRARRRERPFPGDPAGGLAAGVRADLRGVRRRQVRRGGGGVRLLIKSPLKALTLRDAVLFVLVAVVLVPFGTAFWGAALTVSHGFGTHYWIEWRNLGVSNAVTTVVLVPAFCWGALPVRPAPEGPVLPTRAGGGPCRCVDGGDRCILVFDQTPAGPNTSPPLLYTPIPLLIWAALRFGLGGISASMVVITFLAIWGTMRGHGPFLPRPPPRMRWRSSCSCW